MRCVLNWKASVNALIDAIQLVFPFVLDGRCARDSNEVTLAVGERAHQSVGGGRENEPVI